MVGDESESAGYSSVAIWFPALRVKGLGCGVASISHSAVILCIGDFVLGGNVTLHCFGIYFL